MPSAHAVGLCAEILPSPLMRLVLVVRTLRAENATLAAENTRLMQENKALSDGCNDMETDLREQVGRTLPILGPQTIIW